MSIRVNIIWHNITIEESPHMTELIYECALRQDLPNYTDQQNDKCRKDGREKIVLHQSLKWEGLENHY